MSRKIDIVTKLLICILPVIGSLSCAVSNTTKSSVLVIAVDSLPSDKVLCLEEEVDLNRGLSRLCHESVRFTHAFTTSSLTQPALTSLLTAQYPFDHKVHNNGSNFLSAQLETVAESAFKSGFKTSFFSGGPPIWRRSGLSQGFELFEDNITISMSRFFRPARENSELFIKWLDQQEQQPFFSILYLPDLQFTSVSTVDEDGLPRERTYEGQFQELDDVLGLLFKKLTERKKWDSTSVFLVGLNGREASRRVPELNGTSLYTENTQVALMIKPAQKKRDLALNWKVDENVSLVDVGATLFETIGSQFTQPTISYFSVVSLLQNLLQPSVHWERGRPLLIESGWSQWKNLGGIRWAVVVDQYLAILDRPIKIYNTLLDRFQTAAVPLTDSSVNGHISNLVTFTESANYELWKPPTNEQMMVSRLGEKLWGHFRVDQEALEELNSRVSAKGAEYELYAWKALLSLKEKDFSALEKLGKLAGQPIWVYAAERAQDKKATSVPDDPCFNLVFDRRSKKKRECESEMFLDLVGWIRSRGSEVENLNYRRFIKKYRQFLIQRKAAELNMGSGQVWDTPIKEFLEPSVVDLYLVLPDAKPLIVEIDKGLKSNSIEYQ